MGAINAPMVRAARVSVVRIIVVNGYESTGSWALAGVSPIDLGMSCGIESLLLVDATQKLLCNGASVSVFGSAPDAYIPTNNKRTQVIMGNIDTPESLNRTSLFGLK